MSRPAELRTDRLLLRDWREDDLVPFAALNADPEVSRHLGRRLDREGSDAMARRIRDRLHEHGWGLWAVEVLGGPPFIGFVGLTPQTFEAHFTPAVEVGWRLCRASWGNGYAPEAGRAALRFGFEHLGLEEVVSMTAVGNVNSRRVMEKLGMRRDPADDFDNPNVDPQHPVRRHVLYRLRRAEWAAIENPDTVVSESA